MRKLATIKTINNIRPIEGADRIEVASVGGWDVVVAKDVNHSVGDRVVYCEIDSFLPIEPEFEFLRKSSYKKMSDGTEGFRLKTIRMRGQQSQGLIIPLQDAQKIVDRREPIPVPLIHFDNGWDVSEFLGIVKYEKPIPPQLSGVMKGDFPSFLIKTDAERIQNLTDDFSFFNDNNWEVTEKLDGSSVTFYLNDDEFGVCSRNIDLIEDDNNTYWKVARELDIESKMRYYFSHGQIALQGELIGEGIQKNRYKIKGHTVKIFNMFNIAGFKDINTHDAHFYCDCMGLDYVPIIDSNKSLDIHSLNDIKNLIEEADGRSELNVNTLREGLVFQSRNGMYKFKTISNKFLNNE